MKLKEFLKQFEGLNPNLEVCIDQPLNIRRDLISEKRYIDPNDKPGYVALNYSKRYNFKYKERIILIRFRNFKELENFNKYET